MDDNTKQVRDFMKSDFLPSGTAPADERIATALEYIAHHLGQIDNKMDKVIENIWRINRQ